MKSPRTSYEFHIDEIGLDTALKLTWQCNDEDFARMVRMVFGLPLDGPAPMWHFLEIMRIVKDSEKSPK